MEALHKYAMYEGESVSNQLTAAGMFWNISVFLSKLNTSEDEARKESPLNSSRDIDLNRSTNSEQVTPNCYEAYDLNEIWKIVISKMNDIGKTERIEIRRNIYHIIENIFIKHGQGI